MIELIRYEFIVVLLPTKRSRAEHNFHVLLFTLRVHKWSLIRSYLRNDTVYFAVDCCVNAKWLPPRRPCPCSSLTEPSGLSQQRKVALCGGVNGKGNLNDKDKALVKESNKKKETLEDALVLVCNAKQKNNNPIYIPRWHFYLQKTGC